MSDEPLEGIETLMRANGYSVGQKSGLRVVAGSFEIDIYGAFHVHAVTIVHHGASRTTIPTSHSKKARS